MQLNLPAFLLATFLGTVLVMTVATAQTKKKPPRKTTRTQTTLLASSDLVIQYQVNDLGEAEAWFNILLEGNIGVRDPSGSTVTYKLGSTTLILIKEIEDGTPLDKEPVIFFNVDASRINGVFANLTDPKYGVKILWDLHDAGGGTQVGVLQYRRARVGVISNPPFLIKK